LRRALFEALVAEGGEADIVIVGADGTARVVEPWDEPGEPEPAGLADRLYADAPEPPGGTPRLPRIVRFADPATEVRTIAHAVKAHLLSGGRPEDTWVAFPGLPGYLPLVRRVFGALGIPFEVSSGRPVRARPVAEVLLMAARSAASGHPLGPMLAALASGLVGAVAERDALALARACRERGVTHARTDTWAAKLSDAAAHRAAIEAVDDARARLAPLADPVAPPRWRDTLMRVLEAWNIVERSGDTHDPATSVDSRMATGRALEALAQVADDALSVDAGAWEPLRLARLLEERLDAARLPDAKAGPRRIQVVGMLELRGIHPGWLWVGGLLADDFPARPTEDFLLSRTARRALDTLDPGDEARYIFASALRNAMAEGHTLTFSWPAARDDRPAAVSPVLEDLLEVHVEGQELRKRVEAGRAPTIPASPDELDALLGEARAARAESAPWAAHARDSARLARLAEVLDARRDRLGFSAWDGVLDRPPPLPDPLAVTRFEDYVACPARYFYRTLLDLYAERAWDPDLEARTAGVLLHGILDAFVRRVRAGGVDTLHGGSASDRAAWATLLHAVASERLDAARELGGLPGQLAAWHRRRWLAGLVDAAPRGLLAAWLDAEIASLLPTRFDRTEHTFRDHPVGPARLQGRVDRVDRVEGGGALVLDYKTGSAPKREHVEAGTKIQGFVYLDALAGGHGVAVYQELKSAATLRSAGWMGDPSVLSTLKVQPRSATVMSETDRATYAAYLADSASRLAAGRFHPTLAGPQRAGCDWCEFARCCRVDHARNSAIFAQGDERWQAPRRAAGDEEEDG
jgi:ATP-dependent helicase/nuclease subunit B